MVDKSDRRLICFWKVRRGPWMSYFWSNSCVQNQVSMNHRRGVQELPVRLGHNAIVSFKYN